MKVRLIQAPQLGNNGEFIRYKKLFLPTLTLPTLAGLTPSDVDLRITEGFVEDIDFNEQVDLVAVTSQTSQATGAYRIGDEFRERGIQTIIGGVHASMCPDEALKHFDAVAIGEAENIWEDILRDAEKKKLKRKYQSKDFTDLSNPVIPCFHKLNYKNYVIAPFAKTPILPIQTTRGCPHNCSFCVVHKFMGRIIRKKPIASVINEIISNDPSRFLFVDDNVFADPGYARELMKALIPLKKRWACQMSTGIGKYPDMIELAAKAGCHENFMGIESIDPVNLSNVNKSFNKVEEYKNLFKMLKDVGILAQVSMMFGLDNDTVDTLKRTIDTILEWDINYLFIFLITPFPGTKLREDMEKAGRIMDYDWSHYDGVHVTIQPEKITPEELMNSYWEAYRKFYSLKASFGRLWNFKREYIKFFPRDLFHEELFFSFYTWFVVNKKGNHPFSIGS
ncbi:MAG: radical SAM protein [Spirochaetales bacterium]|nr:radical SAM protein [Spirochaetales bacterium]